MFGAKNENSLVAIVHIGSTSAGVVLLEKGSVPRAIAYVREELPFEKRTAQAQRALLIQALKTAAEKAIANSNGAAAGIRTCYCIPGPAWTRSSTDTAHKQFDAPTLVSDAFIAQLAKQALEEQKDIDRAALLEANVSRVLLNGYPTGEPAGKRATSVDVFILTSDSEASIKDSAAETLQSLFPAAKLVWRSGARASLSAVKTMLPSETCVVLEIDAGATDVIVVRKGVLRERASVNAGMGDFLDAVAPGKPASETLPLLDMVEKEQCDPSTCEAMRQAMANAEPKFVQLYGEAFAKLSAARKMPTPLVLLSPQAAEPWLTRLFERIDFTQFTTTATPFVVSAFSGKDLPGVPQNDTGLLSDAALSVACSLVNSEKLTAPTRVA